MFGWLARLFGYASSPVAAPLLDAANRHARDYLDQLQDKSRPVPLPYKAVRHRDAQIATGARAFPDRISDPRPPLVIPPSCPPSQAPSAPPVSMPSAHYEVDRPSAPPVSMDMDTEDRRVPPPETPRPLPQHPPPRPFARSSSGPPPRMSPPPPLPPPARPPRALPPAPPVPGPPRPSRRR